MAIKGLRLIAKRVQNDILALIVYISLTVLLSLFNIEEVII